MPRAYLSGQGARAETETTMIRLLFRLLATIALVGAVIAGTVDAMRSVAANAVELTSLAAGWGAISASSLGQARQAIAENLPSPFPAAFGWFLEQPAVAVLLVASLLFYLVGYRRRRRDRFVLS